MSDCLEIGELFAGVAGFSIGAHKAGMRTKWYVEIDVNCRDVLRYHYPNALIREDVRDSGESNLPFVKVIVAGFPCQDLSVAGHRAGLDGERSGLFFEATRIIRELRPDLAIFENVTGALSSHGGRDFAIILDTLANIGALDIGWAVLDSEWFGVAQRRERVFIVADFRAKRASKILALPEGLRWYPPPSRKAGEETARVFSAGSFGGFREGIGVNRVGGGGTPETVVVARTDNTKANGRGWQEDIAYTLGGSHQVVGPLTANDFRGPNNQNVNAGKIIAVPTYVPQVATPLMGGSGERGYTTSVDTPTWIPVETVAHALTHEGHDASEDGTGRGSPLAYTQQNIRRLTPLEQERLMSWPDEWTKYGASGKHISDSARYKMTGNGIVSNVAEWIARRVIRSW